MTNTVESIYQSCLHEAQIPAAGSTWKMACCTYNSSLTCCIYWKTNLSRGCPDWFSASLISGGQDLMLAGSARLAKLSARQISSSSSMESVIWNVVDVAALTGDECRPGDRRLWRDTGGQGIIWHVWRAANHPPWPPKPPDLSGMLNRIGLLGVCGRIGSKSIWIHMDTVGLGWRSRSI